MTKSPAKEYLLKSAIDKGYRDATEYKRNPTGHANIFFRDDLIRIYRLFYKKH